MMVQEDKNYQGVITIVTMGKRTLISTIQNIATYIINKNFLILLVLDKKASIQTITSATEILKNNHLNYQIVHTDFINIAHARNFGFRYRDVKYHLFLDDDIILSPNFFEELFSLKICTPTLCVPTFFEYVDSNEVYHKAKTWKNLDKDLIRMDPYYKSTATVFNNRYKSIKWISCIGRCLVIITPHSKNNILMFDEDFDGWGVEDIEFAYKNFNNGVEISKISASCIHLYHRIEKSHIEDLNKNLFKFEKKYDNKLDPVAYRLFTWGKLSLDSWIKMKQILQSQDAKNMYHMNYHTVYKK